MKALFISPDSPYESIGGIERYLSNLISYCKAQRKDIIILLPSFDGEPSVTKEGTVTIIKDESLSLLGGSKIRDRYIHQKAKRFAKAVSNVIQKCGIDVICAESFHCSLPPAYSLQLNMVANANVVPVVLHAHSFSSSLLQTELVNQLMWDKVFCVSKSVAGDCFNKGADVNLLKTHYLGVDTSLFRKDQEKSTWLKDRLVIEHDCKIILSASRVTSRKKDILQEKGIIDTIRAFAKIAPYHPELRLVFATATPYKAIMKQFDNAREKLLGYLKLHGVADKATIEIFAMDEMPNVYNGADVFVLPSENETLGQVFIEAMSCDVPVIGTKVGGIPEIIRDKYNGFLVSPNDPTILSQRMEELLFNEKLHKEYIDRAKEIIDEKFTADKQFYVFFERIEKIAKEY